MLVTASFAVVLTGLLLAPAHASTPLSPSSPSLASALKPLPKNPLLFQLNTRVRIDELTKAEGRQCTLDDFPDAELAALAQKGYDYAYFLGVWQTGEYGIKKSVKLLDLEPCMKGLPREAACSSPFAVTDYSVHKDFGGDEALQRLKQRCHKHGLRLMVDFVPNHLAVDHPWTKTHPELLIQGGADCIRASPQNFFKAHDKIFAHGKDMYYDGWEDTVQINYGNQKARDEMCKVLCKMASLSDGVRCDMAMLICEDILEKTWGGRLAPHGQPRANGQFWPPTIKAAKKVNPGFSFVAECYWDREFELHTFGFDFAYDKTLYDRLKALDVYKVKGHLSAALGYQSKLVRFLENHDEERAAECWKDTKMNIASAVISFTIPGMHFIHDGQQEVNWVDGKIALTVVNFCGDVSNGHVILPEKHFAFLRGKKVKLSDMLSETVIEKDGGILLGDHNGLWLSLEPWKSHLFSISY